MSYIGHFDNVLSDTGHPIIASISVFNAGTEVLATIYSTPSGIIKDNPFITDVLGRFSFFASSGAYDIEVSGAGITLYKIEYVELAEGIHAAQHQSGGADVIKLDDLAAPDDNIDLNVSPSKHGLYPKIDSSLRSMFLKTWWNFEDFDGAPDTASGVWIRANGGTGAYSANAVGTSLRHGIMSLATGTTNAGYAYILAGGSSANAFLFGAGVYTIEADVYIVNLSDGAETYTLRVGFGDSGTGAPTNGAYFYYTDVGGGGATPNWYRNTASNGVITSTDTGVAVVAGAWIRLKVVVNAGASSVEFFINEVPVGSNVANIPSGAGRNTGAVYSLIKSVGTTSRIANIDWAWLHIDLSTSR